MIGPLLLSWPSYDVVATKLRHGVPFSLDHWDARGRCRYIHEKVGFIILCQKVKRLDKNSRI